jgi:hypothetical protein
MTMLPPRLAELGDRLEAAATADLVAASSAIGAERAAASVRPRRRNRPRRIALLAVAAAVVIPGAAFAANALIDTGEVAKSLPAGTLALAGTEPTCTVVHENVEFHCTLARPPAAEVEDWKGTVEPTVDSTKHVNGGCRSLASDGRTWQCYLGQEAVRQQTIGATLLGVSSAGPAAG